MAKKLAGSKQAEPGTPSRKRTGKAVRLDLSPKDHERLERASAERGLSKSSYARMAVLALIKQDEESHAK
jgi:predicted HicB family RNase H-like nuclease